MAVKELKKKKEKQINMHKFGVLVLVLNKGDAFSGFGSSEHIAHHM
jgi:hypothetical protein